jgi:ABC-2 type transport system permease protein
MSVPAFRLALRLRLPSVLSAAFGLIAVMILVGALFPAIGDSIGKLDVPAGVANLLGGADYASITGWYRSEIAIIYGPLVIAAVAITAAVALTAGEEEDRILALVLAQPVSRGRLVLGKAGGVGASVLLVAAATWIGLLIGVAVAGGGIPVGHMAALAVHLALFGAASGAVALLLAAATGRRALAAGGAAAYAVAGYLVNGFAPLVGAIDWLKYLVPFHYYAAHDPLGRGLDLGDVAVLFVFAAVLTAGAAVAIEHRDLRA